MKRTKNKKKDTSESNASSSIQDYFKSNPKEFNVKTVYIQALKEKLNNFDVESDCQIKEIDSHRDDGSDNASSVHCNEGTMSVQATEGVVENITKKCDGCNEWRQKYTELKKSHLKLTFRHTNVLMKYDALLETVKSNDRLKTEQLPNETVSETVSESGGSDDVFTANEVKCLESISLEEKKDSSFILQCIQYSYKNNVVTLCKKTLKGTLELVEIQENGSVELVRPGKDPLTPDKVKRIEKLFINRVCKSKCLAGEFGERVKQTNINKLIASAIKNVSNKEKANEAGPSQNADLNL